MVAKPIGKIPDGMRWYYSKVILNKHLYYKSKILDWGNESNSLAKMEHENRGTCEQNCQTKWAKELEQKPKVEHRPLVTF